MKNIIIYSAIIISLFIFTSCTAHSYKQLTVTSVEFAEDSTYVYQVTINGNYYLYTNTTYAVGDVLVPSRLNSQ